MTDEIVFTDVLLNARFECINCKGGYVDIWKLVGESTNSEDVISPHDIISCEVAGNDVIIKTSNGLTYCLLNKRFDNQLIEDINEVITNEGYSVI